MKDEELFKAWKSEQYKDQSTEEKMEFVEHLHTFPKYFEKTFLAGLKAGRPQWHDLREDPNDVPKDNNEVLVYMWGSYYLGYYKQYDGEDSSWHFEDFDEESEQVIAWCEIPTFEKE